MHLSDTSIWCDARRARDVCFASVAGSVGRSRHGQLIASAATLSLLARPHHQSSGQDLSVPFGQPFTLGTQRLELFRSGHAFGSASLLVQLDEQRVVYAGAINPHGSRLGGAIDHRRADVLVVRAPYSPAQIAFGDPQQAMARLCAAYEQLLSQNASAVLLVTSTAKALDMAALLSDMKAPVCLHRRYHEAATRARAAGAELPALPVFRASAGKAQVIVWPLRARKALPSSRLPTGSKLFLVSGRASEPAAIAAAGAHAGFALSNQADHQGLLDYIRSSGARSVYLVDSPDRGSDLALQLPGIEIHALGPPTQLQLF